MGDDKSEIVAKQIVSKALGVNIDGLELDGDIESVESWDSLRHITIVSALEDSMDRPLSVEEILSATSIKGIANILQNKIVAAAK